MAFIKMDNHQRYQITQEEYQELKITMHNTPRSAEHRKKLSEASKGANHHFYGKHHTKKEKKNLSINSPKNKPVFCLETLKTYRSTMEASRQTKIHNSLISNCCLKKQKTAGGYHWFYLYDQINKNGEVISGAINLGLITETEM